VSYVGGASIFSFTGSSGSSTRDTATLTLLELPEIVATDFFLSSLCRLILTMFWFSPQICQTAGANTKIVKMLSVRSRRHFDVAANNNMGGKLLIASGIFSKKRCHVGRAGNLHDFHYSADGEHNEILDEIETRCDQVQSDDADKRDDERHEV